ncbi:NADPH dehydrogenase [Promethearchaeum syntrophicum]|uniref:NADPH dehydrogenase n=1 Tax=Promethearchaeum syntrophicum TaxID=2594042 RepID=A0A5B9DBK4_9ARCH|nr:NADPH dehydrogenase [Candidatus Prometheoarchaeum syntrophicum]QEE16558.1 salicylyl-CoA 5-hydroxylase [Candidatus Prometheoarchaeum syntrophicum]
MLFTEYKIKDLFLKNRIVMPPMCMYSSDRTGIVQPFHLVHYGTRAQGGAGLIIIEATAVEARGRISGNDLGIWNDDQIPGLKSIVDIVHGFGAKIAIQLAHAGRKATVAQGISSWNSQFSDEYPIPIKMEESHIRQVVLAFSEAARRAQLIGFDAVEIHGAHGYLINQFISPLVNHREDSYGCKNGIGIKFLQEIIKSVKNNFKGPIGLRISAEEYSNNGLHPHNFIPMLAEILKDHSTSIDFINVSSGGVIEEGFPSKVLPGYQIDFAHEIKKGINIPILAGGMLSDPDMINKILNGKKADLIWLGRELLRNPYWPLHTSEYFKIEQKKPPQYKRAEPYFRNN